jgi:hypothetical protein
MESVAASYDPLAWVYNRHWGSNADWILRAVKELVLRDLAPLAEFSICAVGPVSSIGRFRTSDTK